MPASKNLVEISGKQLHLLLGEQTKFMAVFFFLNPYKSHTSRYKLNTSRKKVRIAKSSHREGR